MDKKYSGIDIFSRYVWRALLSIRRTSGGKFSTFLSIDFYEACSNLYLGRYGALPYLPVLQKSSYVPEIVLN